MIDYDFALHTLRNLTAIGNTVAATYLHLLETCPAEQRGEILRQIDTFVRSFQYEHERNRVGPSELKNETETPAWTFRY